MHIFCPLFHLQCAPTIGLTNVTRKKSISEIVTVGFSTRYKTLTFSGESNFLPSNTQYYVSKPEFLSGKKYLVEFSINHAHHPVSQNLFMCPHQSSSHNETNDTSAQSMNRERNKYRLLCWKIK